MPQHPRTKLFIAFLMLITVLLGYNYFAQPFAPSPQETPTPTATPTTSQTTAEATLANLTAKEKISQMLAVPLVVDNDPQTSPNIATGEATVSAQVAPTPEPASISADWVEINNPGFLLVFGQEIRKSRASEVISTYRSLPRAQGKNLLPAAVVDHEGGSVQRLSGIGYTELPSWRQFCQLTASERTELLQESSVELQETGINLVLAPVLDLSSASTGLAQRSCSSDPTIVASRSGEFAQQFLANDITPVFKHFPGIGAVTSDLHLSFAQTEVSNEASLLYRNLLEQFPQAGVLITHVGVTNSQTPNQPCSLSSECVTALRRYFPSVLTFTDSLTMESASYSATGSAKPLTTISQEAVLAGNDVLVYDQEITAAELEEIFSALVSAYEQDQAFASQVDSSTAKIINYKQQHNLLPSD